MNFQKYIFKKYKAYIMSERMDLLDKRQQ